MTNKEIELCCHGEGQTRIRVIKIRAIHCKIVATVASHGRLRFLPDVFPIILVPEKGKIEYGDGKGKSKEGIVYKSIPFYRKPYHFGKTKGRISNPL